MVDRGVADSRAKKASKQAGRGSPRELGSGGLADGDKESDFASWGVGRKINKKKSIFTLSHLWRTPTPRPRWGGGS
jgi:hypothetical protein